MKPTARDREALLVLQHLRRYYLDAVERPAWKEILRDRESVSALISKLAGRRKRPYCACSTAKKEK